MPRAVRLEMAPNVIVKQGTTKLGQVLLFGQALGCSEELVLRFWWRMDGVVDVEKESMSIESVLQRITGKVILFSFFNRD